MKVLFANRVKQQFIDSISISNLDPNYNVASIYSNILEDIAKCSAASSVITIKLLQSTDINSLFIGWHTITGGTAVFKNSGSIVKTITLTLPNLYYKTYFDAIIADELVLNVTSSIGNIFVGSVAFGLAVNCINVQKPYTVEYTATNKVDQTDGANVLVTGGTVVQQFSVTLAKNTLQEAAPIIEGFNEVGKGNTFWLDRFDDNLDYPALFCFCDTSLQETEMRGFYDLTFSIKEAR